MLTKQPKRFRWGWLIFVLILLLFPSYYLYQNYFAGEYYYTQIINEGERFDAIDSTGVFQGYDYRYQQKAYNKDGDETVVEFTANRNTPLRESAYLRLKMNDRKGNLSWEEVQEKDLPKEALAKLAAQKDSWQ